MYDGIRQRLRDRLTWAVLLAWVPVSAGLVGFLHRAQAHADRVGVAACTACAGVTCSPDASSRPADPGSAPDSETPKKHCTICDLLLHWAACAAEPGTTPPIPDAVLGAPAVLDNQHKPAFAFTLPASPRAPPTC